jgi:hypothetical protein
MNKSGFDPKSEESMKRFLNEMKEKRINHDAKIVCVGDCIRESSK